MRRFHDGRHVNGESIEEFIVSNKISEAVERVLEYLCEGVHFIRYIPNANRSMINCVHRGDVCKKRLARANVAGSLFAANVLLSSFESVSRYDDPTKLSTDSLCNANLYAGWPV